MSAKILVVEDNELNLGVIKRFLSKQGYELSSAQSGELAIQLIDQNEFDLIVLDLMLGKLSGDEVLKVIRKLKTRLELPVIISSSLDSTNDIVECLKNGANDYITKPLNLSILKARIDTQLHLKELNTELTSQKIQNLALSKSSSLGAIAAALAHHINNPIAAISGNAQIIQHFLEEQLLGDLKLKKSIQVIIDKSKEVSDTIASLRRIISNNQNSKAFYANDFILSLDKILGNQLTVSKVDSTYEVDERFKTDKVFLDYQMVMQMVFGIIEHLLDLVKNHSDRWILLKFATHGQDGLDIIMSCSADKLETEDYEHIFLPIASVEKRSFISGLGLSYCLSLVKTLGGTFRYAYEYPKTTFVARFPKGMGEAYQLASSL